MRLLIELDNPDLAKSFSGYLKSLPIEHMLEVVKVTDWGSSSYGHQTYKIWIDDEDQYDRAIAEWNEFIEDPQNPKFKPSAPDEFNPFRPKKIVAKIEETPSPLTHFIVILCAVLFFFDQFLMPTITRDEAHIPDFIPSKVEQSLLYDYPVRAEKVTELLTLYGLDDWPKEAAPLRDEVINTPVWHGLYEPVVQYLRGDIQKIDWTPMFEKIRVGEWWRLISPIFLHANILHLVFNVLCFLVLGKEMERMLGPAKLALFIVLAAIVSDTAQYLMTGYRFLGISGVICAMLAFIAVRQKIAPWEGYRLEKSSVNFMLIFIFGMAALSIGSFIASLYDMKFIGTPVANAAHLSGLVIGFLLARTSLFQWKG